MMQKCMCVCVCMYDCMYILPSSIIIFVVVAFVCKVLKSVLICISDMYDTMLTGLSTDVTFW